MQTIWRPPSLIELTPIIFNMELTYLGSGASISNIRLVYKMLNGNLKLKHRHVV